MKSIKVGIASDHAGYRYKKELIVFLLSEGYKVEDFGTDSEESMDYPDTTHPLASAIQKKSINFGFALCGSGNGVTMTANKYQNVRAALCWKPEIAELARQHNNANICGIPARFISYKEAKKIVEIFLKTEFEGGRHKRRVDKINVE